MTFSSRIAPPQSGQTRGAGTSMIWSGAQERRPPSGYFDQRFERMADGECNI